MAALGDFDRYVLPFVNGAPAPAVEDAIRDACIEFCTRAGVLRATLDPITLTPAVPEIELDAPEADTQIVEVTAAWLPEGPVDPLTRPELDALYPLGWASASVGATREVRGFYSRRPGLLSLVPALNAKAPRALRLEVTYAPTRDAQEVPDLLYQRYAETIAAGALLRLHQHPGAEYADVSRVSAYSARFNDDINRMADDAPRGFGRKQLRTAPEII